ncbi:leukocidin/hemolysin toxin family protein [Staphylococcus intermedius]|uniref:Synergohymenotropic toxin n=1 Tax=Staphylococcus intermedius NCTC 11048 TaxID=1141106 RepID=A0A380G7Z1_STAIN|nr:leukocidin/hemolysin toxin family protein [Staphylococcus intermedius]PCF64585.1 leucotoxin LukD [Staphylococcus intermedius]PCF81545.1 leucotoxin LukD [Staphylococcus intermedius]PCF84305.1 leucotoxin LukD [Staphylococcus intermedius]PNZ50938.1 beta-channel forming cytolysin [Staphylococcus intermedius NCTC 11048]SUM46393.1 synergohymenotropic toxin [Staphylococcus intermedius NCTC 11048]
MKMDKLLKTVTATSVALMLFSNSAYAASQITPVAKEKVDDKITLYKTTATSDSDKLNISQLLTFNFIEDKSYDKDTLVLKAAGNINSGYQAPNPSDYIFSNLYWAAKYTVLINANAKGVNVVDYAPKNQNEEFQVQNTLGYTFGGDISISKGLAGGLNGNESFSETINYKQQSYRTTIDKRTDNKTIGWDVEAHKIMNGGWGPYGRDSYHEIYGNELFLGGRQSKFNAGQNFLPAYQMPVLARGNFNPEFLGVLSHQPKAGQKSKISVTYHRDLDNYTDYWNGFHWTGMNYKDQRSATFTSNYEIDWTAHTVKLIDTKMHEKNPA